MASIRRRGEKWEVSVRRRGCPGLYRSFSLIADARKWGREAETRLERNPFGMDPAVAKSVRFSDLLTRYRKEISPRKKGAGVESVRIRSLLMEPWTDASLRTLTPRIFADYRDRRVGVVSDETVRREIGLIRHVLNVAANEWGYPLPQNPIDRISLPKPSKARDRRLEADELDLAVKGKLYLAKQTHSANHQVRNRNGHAARRVNVHWLGGGVRLDRWTLHIETTKNGHPRTIPLSPEAIRILSDLPRNDDRVFPTTASAVRQAWVRICRRADIQDLHFHDLRHEAISRLFEKGLSIPEVALISGHRDYRQLFRYTHLRAEDLVQKL